MSSINDAKSDLWSKRSSTKKGRKRKISSESIVSAMKPVELACLENTLRSRSEIFTYFFTALTYDIILNREIIGRTSDLGKSSLFDVEQIEQDADELPAGSKSSNIFDNKPCDAKSYSSNKRKEVSYPGDGVSHKGSVASTAPYKTIVEKALQNLGHDNPDKMSVEILSIERIVFKNGNIYEGTCNDYLMHGYGTFTWSDRTVYRGEFKNGFITGKGQMILPDLSKYEGDFCQGNFHGTGFLNLISTSLYYYGNWKNGKKDGKGWIIYEPGDWYEGDWSNDLRNGIGYRRYKNGAKYKGEWVDNKKQGKGKILLENNDYYNGEWYDDKPDGYGEYTWNLRQNEAFCFPLYNSYKGSWKNGERDGVGIMNFGSESGSKYAGTWSKNNKHGPGVMICGNGLVLESNPLFEFNKPVHKNSQITLEQLDKPPQNTNQSYDNTDKGSYYDILKIVNSRLALSEIDACTIRNITNKSSNIPTNMFVKLVDSISGSKKSWCPLEIPTHTIPEEVNFSFFIDVIFDYASKNSRFDDLFEPEELKEPGVPIGLPMFKNFNKYRASFTSYRFSILTNSISLEAKANDPDKISDNSTDDNVKDVRSDEDKIQEAKQEETDLFRNAILIYLPRLKAIYNRYALLGDVNSSERKKVDYKPVLIRLFLWQIFRDAHLQDGVQLAQVDSFMWQNPHSCLDTNHYPFESIYFYQFLQYLMACAWLIFEKKLEKNPDMKLLMPSKIFRNFLDNNFFGKMESTGSALNEHLNLVPIKKLYSLFASISEPMSVKTFLNATYRGEKEKIPCFAAVSSGNVPKLEDGFNVVPMAHELSYVQIPEPIVSRDSGAEQVENLDQFSRSLLTFRTLGKKKLLDCLINLCPKVLIDDKFDFNYNLTFLEFFEVVIECAFLKAAELVKDHEIKQASTNPKITSTERLHMGESVSKKDKLGKKKKSKKSTITIGVLG